MVTKGKFAAAKTNVVGTYKIDTPNNISFTVILKQNDEGFREFEIVLSGNGSDDYSEVFDHPFYNNFVLPWTYNKAEIEPSRTFKADNVVDLSKYRPKNDRLSRT